MRRDNSIRVDLADLPDVVFAIPVDQVRDEGVDHEHDHRPAASEILDGEVLAAPFLADLLEREQDEDRAEPNATGRTVPFGQPLEHVANDVE